MNLKRVFLYLLIVSVAASAVLGVAIILFGEFGQLESRILGTSLTFTCMSLLGLACGANLEAGRLRVVPIAGIICSVISAIIWIVIIWSEKTGGEYVVKIVFSTTILACALSYSSLMDFASLENKYRWAQYAAYLAVALLVGILFYTIWYDNNPNEEFMARVIGADSVVIAAFTVIVPIFHKLSGPGDELEDISNEISKLREKLTGLENKKRTLESERSEDS